MNNLAGALSAQGKYVEAEQMHRKELELGEKVFSEGHPATLVSMHNLACVLGYRKKYKEAEEMHRSTLALEEKVLGMEHPDTLRSIDCFASVLDQQGYYKDAMLLYDRAHRGFMKTLGSDHPDTRDCAKNYTRCQNKVERGLRGSNSLPPLEKAHEGFENVSDSDHSEAQDYVADYALAQGEDERQSDSRSSPPPKRADRASETTLDLNHLEPPAHSSASVLARKEGDGKLCDQLQSKYLMFVGLRTQNFPTFKAQPLFGKSMVSMIGDHDSRKCSGSAEAKSVVNEDPEGAEGI